MDSGFAVCAGVLVACCAAYGQTYYVDFDGGSDNGNGIAPASPFKHCPGDKEATGRAKAAKLSPGDRVIFKGGVRYRGEITVLWSGEEGKPIVYDGNTEGKFGRGKAIIDGGEPIAAWTKVASAKDVEDNPNWGKLYHACLDADRAFFTFNLYEGDTYLNAAQDPKPEDPFFHDRLSSYRNTKTADEGSLSDAACFTSTDPQSYKGAYLALHVQPNVVCYQQITGYIPAEHKVTFKAHGQQLYGGPRGHCYSLLNTPKVLSKPGEYYLDENNAKDGKVRLVLWPHKPGAKGPENVTISTRQHAFLISNANHLAIEGFKICQQGGTNGSAVSKLSNAMNTGIAIRNNEICRIWAARNVNISTSNGGISGAITLQAVSQSLVEGNCIYENRCMGVLGIAFNDSVCRNNYLRRNGSTGISLHACERSKMLYNVVWDNLGLHANGLTVYMGSRDMLVEGNEVYNSNDCLTIQDGSKITVRRNILDAHGTEACIAAWAGKPLKNVTIENNLLLRSGRNWQSGIYEDNGIEGCLIRNNIIDGIACSKGGIKGEMSNNLWTSKGRNFQGEKPGDKFEADLKKIFVDPGNQDYRLRPDSPAINAGCETDGKEDIAGTVVPQGGKPDIGAYEFVAGGPRYRKGHAGSLAPAIRASAEAKTPSH